jgi:hypothetical protein
LNQAKPRTLFGPKFFQVLCDACRDRTSLLAAQYITQALRHIENFSAPLIRIQDKSAKLLHQVQFIPARAITPTNPGAQTLTHTCGWMSSLFSTTALCTVASATRQSSPESFLIKPDNFQ